jgi:hypothetical protein
VLSTRTFSGFHAGVYAIWNIGGHVLIQVANRVGLNAVISGVFFGAASTLPPPTASAVFVPPPDVATQGNWVGKYGAASFMIANDPLNPPGFPATIFTGASTWTWAASTSAVRAPPTVSITAPTANQTVFGNFTVVANAASSGGTIASVQLLLDGNPPGPLLTSGLGRNVFPSVGDHHRFRRPAFTGRPCNG